VRLKGDIPHSTLYPNGCHFRIS